MANDLIERLRHADANSQQRVWGSRIFGEAADEIEKLRAEVAMWQSVKHSSPRLEIADARIAELEHYLRIFLGHDERFQVAVGGNPAAIDSMLSQARSCLDRGPKDA